MASKSLLLGKVKKEGRFLNERKDEQNLESRQHQGERQFL